MEIVKDFFNKTAKDIDAKFFPDVKYYGDDKNCTKVHYSLELFNNGCLGYDQLSKRLAKACKCQLIEIEEILNKYILK